MTDTDTAVLWTWAQMMERTVCVTRFQYLCYCDLMWLLMCYTNPTDYKFCMN